MTGTWVVLLGVPGCGKGTQSENLVKIGYEVISVGDILRKNQNTVVKGQTKTIGELIGSGILLPDDVVIKVVKLELEKFGDARSKNLIFDGFPRTIGQAEALDQLAIEFYTSIKYVLNFEIDDEVVVKRIIGRYKCTKCGKIYNDFYLKPKKEDVCDVCDSIDFERRADDTECALRNRLSEYYKKTQPLIDFYKKSGKLCSINADNDFEIVKNSVLNILNKENK